MSNLNKFGELEEANCTECGSPVKAEWKACPHCGSPRDPSTRCCRVGRTARSCPECGADTEPDCSACSVCGTSLRSRTLGPARDDSGVSYRCPGCAERATSADGKLCPTCKAFVHLACLTVGAKVGSLSGWFAGLDRWKAVCPICRSALGEFEGVDGTPVTLDGTPLPRFRRSPTDDTCDVSYDEDEL